MNDLSSDLAGMKYTPESWRTLKSRVKKERSGMKKGLVKSLMLFNIRFGKRCERRIVDWVVKNVPPQSVIIEFGSGNGHLLVSLAKQGSFARLVGIDYSEGAIELARACAQKEGCAGAVQYVAGNLLNLEGELLSSLPLVDLVIDKGTFDAICLSELSGPENNSDGPQRRINNLCVLFKTSLRLLLKPAEESRFLITSCNWTKEELLALFQPEFQLVDEIEHPSISFGGSKGQTVTTLVFK